MTGLTGSSGRSGVAAWLLFAASMAAYMLLGAPALLRLGIPYVEPYGPPYAKFHPGTYALVLACLFALASQGNPLRVLGQQLGRSPLLAGYFACLALVLAWAVLRHGVARGGFMIDSLWMPAFAALALGLFDEPQRRRLFVLAMLLLGLNAVVAIGEALAKASVFPLLDDRGAPVRELYFRSTALFGHPLQNALVTVSLLPAVTLLRWPIAGRLALGLLLLLATLAFGGRVSLALGLLIYGACGIVYLVRSALQGRFSYLQLTGGLFALMVGVTAAVGLVAASGLGSRIFENLALDDSGLVRLRSWDVFSFASAESLWFGMPPAGIDHVTLRAGLDPSSEAIENYWIGLALLLGVSGFVPFVMGMACLGLLLWREAAPAMRAGVVFYLLSSSTGNTLASKTASLTLLTVVVLTSRGPGRAEPLRARPWPAAGPASASLGRPAAGGAR